MKIFVLYDKSGIHSGRVLGSNLIRELSREARVQKGRPKRLEMLHSKGNSYDYIINFGWFRDFDAKGATVLNVPNKISLSSNKRKARIRFRDAGIPAPQLWLKSSNIRSRDLPVIGRTTHHTKGRGLWVCEDARDLSRATAAGATHFLKLIPNTREFRVHIVAPGADLDGLEPDDYMVIKLSEKIPRPDADCDSIVKNHDNGWFFSYPQDRKDPVLAKCRAVAKQAICEFGLHWGAVDIMVSKDTGEPYVLEINSTPCLTDDSANTLEKYARGMKGLLGIEPIERKKKKEEEPEQEPEPVLKPRRTSPRALRKISNNKRQKLKRLIKRQSL